MLAGVRGAWAWDLRDRDWDLDWDWGELIFVGGYLPGELAKSYLMGWSVNCPS